MGDHALSRRIADILALQPDASALEYDGQWATWGQLAELANRMAAVTGPVQVGMLLRNRPAHVAALLGVLLGGGTVVTVNPSRGDDRTRADIAALDVPFVVGEPDDLAALVPAGPSTVSISDLLTAPHVSTGSAGSTSQ